MEGINQGIAMKDSWPTGGWPCVLAGSGDMAQVELGTAAGRERKQASRSQADRKATIRVAHRYRAAPAQVFAAWLDPEVAGSWLFATASHPMAAVEIDARVGGRFRFVERRRGEIAEYTGEYVDIVPPRRLVFALAVGERPAVSTRVTVDIVPSGKGCALTLIHDHVPRGLADRMEGRWMGILYGLGVTLDQPIRCASADQE